MTAQPPFDPHPGSKPAFSEDGAMKGFDTEFHDLAHYIRVITDRIWEGRRLNDIHLYYSDPCNVETALSVSTSIEDVVAGTQATLAMFPDRRLLAEDVIQSGDSSGGYLSSHRIISPMTHFGAGNFGPPTGRRIHARTIADCVCLNNRIVHEWLVRDHAAIAKQIGMTPQGLAQQWLRQRGGWTKGVAGPAPQGYISHISTEPLAVLYAQAIEDFAYRRGSVAPIYDDAAHQIGPGETTCYGQAEIASFWQGLFGALQVEHFAVEHLALQQGRFNSPAGDPADRIALRFRAKTIHGPDESGVNRYGIHSNRPVELLGILHAEFSAGRVIREWVLVDDVAIWMQILNPATS
jgi:predicted ester cyclase